MQTEELEDTYPLTRLEKRKLAHLGELRCEACNRWHPVDEDAYEYIMKDDKDYVYLCPRARCKQSRAENLIDYNLVAHPDKSPIGKLYHPVDGERNLYRFRLYGF